MDAVDFVSAGKVPGRKNRVTNEAGVEGRLARERDRGEDIEEVPNRMVDRGRLQPWEKNGEVGNGGPCRGRGSQPA